MADRLKAEVEKIIAAGHLRPGYWSVGFTDADLKKLGDYNADYWHNPADTAYYLLRARPHLPAATQSAVDSYLQVEFARFPFTQYVHVGWNTGASRNPTRWPPDFNFLNDPPLKGTYEFKGWVFHPFNFYAAWKWAQLYGNAASIFNAMKLKLQPPPGDSFFTSQPPAYQGPPGFALPSQLNAYIAGYMGYVELEKLATGAASPDKVAELNRLLALRLQLLDDLDPAMRPGPDAPGPILRGTEAGGFLYLVPELADYFRQNRLARVRYYANTFDRLMPYWFVTRSDEQLEEIRGGIGPNGSGGSECSVNTLYFPHSLFQARAMVLQTPRPELEKYLDVPAFPVGDFFYIDKLVSILEASAVTDSTPPAAPTGLRIR